MTTAQFLILAQILKFGTLAILFSIPHLRKEEKRQSGDIIHKYGENTSLIFNSLKTVKCNPPPPHTPDVQILTAFSSCYLTIYDIMSHLLQMLIYN